MHGSLSVPSHALNSKLWKAVEIRESLAVAATIQQKRAPFHRLSEIGPTDFEFVEVKKVTKQNGHPVFDGKGIKDLYGRGSIYIRLTRSVFASKVSILGI